ncbi:MAG TPA: glycosyltransferase family 9 protein, partial [Planctomycetota bacterium]|nr:glycosyltransferase family 9 protein [Planctomycetota bacterium]
AMLEASAVAITLDSAPLHLASAVDTPTISLFGPTDPARVAPRSEEHVVLRRTELECLACYERRCPLRRRACLPDLPAGDVLDRLEGMLRS